MTGGRSLRLAAHDLRRHWRHFAAAGVGIALGVAALTYFAALGLEVRDLLLAQTLPSRAIEVAPRSADVDMFALRLDLGRDVIDPEQLQSLAAIDGVAAVYPRRRLLVPAVASGGAALFGTGMQTEVVADGLDPALLRGELGGRFRDVSTGFDGGRCAVDGDCGVNGYCRHDGNQAGVCRPYIPAVVSPYVIDLYNSGLRRAYRLPKINPNALDGISFEVLFGGSSFRKLPVRPISERVRIVGVSGWAIPLGLTLPLGEVERVNRRLLGADAGRGAHAAILKLVSDSAVPDVVAAVESAGLEVRDREAERAARVVSIVTAVLALGGVILVVVSAAHVMHVFALILMVRRRELGLLRAVGASRADIVRLQVVEAGVIGLAAGAVGVGLARAAAALSDRAAAYWLPDLTALPATLFRLEWKLAAAVLALAVIACVLSAVGPARRAASGDPADALSGR